MKRILLGLFFAFNLVISALDNLTDIPYYFSAAKRDGNIFLIFRYYFIQVYYRAWLWEDLLLGKIKVK